MKKIFVIILSALFMLFSACTSNNEAAKSDDNNQSNTVSITENNSKTSSITQPKHSKYYIEDYTADDIIQYFSEVALNAEYNNGNTDSSDSLIKKWREPIKYEFIGNPTNEDIDTIESLVETLSKIEGLPTISEALPEEVSNLLIFLCGSDEFPDVDNTEKDDLNGYFTVWWYDNSLEIYDSEIYLRNDIEQDIRSRVLQHEVYQSLGLLQDSERMDSIIFSGDITADKPNELDLLILKLLYSEEITPKMNYDDCAKIINNLYY